MYETIEKIGETLKDEGLSKKEIIFHLYCHVIGDLYGYLGPNNRKQIPHCVRTEIQDMYPSN